VATCEPAHKRAAGSHALHAANYFFAERLHRPMQAEERFKPQVEQSWQLKAAAQRAVATARTAANSCPGEDDWSCARVGG